MGCESHHLVVWFRVARKPKYTCFIIDSKGKGLIVARKGISTHSTPYLRQATLCGLNVV